MVLSRQKTVSTNGKKQFFKEKKWAYKEKKNEFTIDRKTVSTGKNEHFM